MNQIFFKEKRMCHPNANLNLIEENVIQTKSGIMINVDGSVKSIIYVRKFFFGIVLHALAKWKIFSKH